MSITCRIVGTVPVAGLKRRYSSRLCRHREKKDEHRLGLKPIVRKVWSPVKLPLLYASAAQRKPELPVELSGVLELRAATL